MAQRRAIGHHVADILQAIGEAEQLIAGKTLAQYRRDFATRRAVERCIEIISEAARRLPAAKTNKFPDIPWKAVKGIGNVLRHEYHNVADGIIYRVAVKHLPPLKAAVTAMAEDEVPVGVRKRAPASKRKRSRKAGAWSKDG